MQLDLSILLSGGLQHSSCGMPLRDRHPVWAAQRLPACEKDCHKHDKLCHAAAMDVLPSTEELCSSAAAMAHNH